jgi:hypothetical protein
MRIKSILFLLVCFLLSHSFTLSAIACECNPPCEGCESCEAGVCVDDDDKCGGSVCCDGTCCSAGQTCCNGTCCDNCCNSTTCCPNSDDICCTDSGSYCCKSGESCCKGTCCDPNLCLDCNSITGQCESICDPNCEVCDDGNCIDIDVNSVSVDEESICVGCSVTFTVKTDPCGYGGKVSWSAIGGNPNSGTGASFTTSWNTAGIKTATASLCDSSDSNDVTVVEVATLEPNDTNGITEFDDGDGDPNTRSFAARIVDPNHEPNIITVIATPNPDVNEADLPACWTLTGGTGTGKLLRTVDRTTTGVTTITCECNTSSKTTKIYVVEVELGFQNSKMGTPKVIDPLDPPKNVRIGVIKADSITFKAILTPNVTLGDSEYSWTGEKNRNWPNYFGYIQHDRE